MSPGWSGRDLEKNLPLVGTLETWSFLLEDQPRNMNMEEPVWEVTRRTDRAGEQDIVGEKVGMEVWVQILGEDECFSPHTNSLGNKISPEPADTLL